MKSIWLLFCWPFLVQGMAVAFPFLANILKWDMSAWMYIILQNQTVVRYRNTVNELLLLYLKYLFFVLNYVSLSQTIGRMFLFVEIQSYSFFFWKNLVVNKSRFLIYFFLWSSQLKPCYGSNNHSLQIYSYGKALTEPKIYS